MIFLKRQSPAEYQEWSRASKENYKNENIKNGLTLEEAERKTDEDFERLLPLGLESKDQYIFSIFSDEELIGTLWFGVRGALNNRKAFIYDIVLDEKHRGKGYGQSAMTLLEMEVKKLGLKHIGLHVFGHNKVARAVYEKLGYEVTNLNLEKVL